MRVNCEQTWYIRHNRLTQLYEKLGASLQYGTSYAKKKNANKRLGFACQEAPPPRRMRRGRYHYLVLVYIYLVLKSKLFETAGG